VIIDNQLELTNVGAIADIVSTKKNPGKQYSTAAVYWSSIGLVQRLDCGIIDTT